MLTSSSDHEAAVHGSTATLVQVHCLGWGDDQCHVGVEESRTRRRKTGSAYLLITRQTDVDPVASSLWRNRDRSVTSHLALPGKSVLRFLFRF